MVVRFMGVGQDLTMPIFFANNAIYPIGLMPNWLKVVAMLNPLSDEVDGPRTPILKHYQSSFGLVADAAALITAPALLTFVATRMYPRMTE